MEGHLISVRDITKVYNSSQVEVHALRGVSLDIKRGEFVSITGPSGSGKTTLMDILGCLSRPTSGEYYFEDRNVNDLDDDVLAELRNKKIGFVFQTFNLLPRLTALQNVELPLIYGGVPARKRLRRAQEVLQSVGLGERMHHRPSALSGGQVQRVAVARALVNRPSLILADEPTGNLDSKSEKEITALFKELHRNGNTLVIVTHNEAVAGQAERIVAVRDGELISDTPMG
ncbi:MAG: ABC transporter ATP-binding protein [Candidatus Hydrogenedentota bacterium]|nr:MAG: ABC transporter ATP-binding protein [Candidatus Hydrogenedentota bacterium]